MSLVSLNTLSVGEQAYVNKLGFGANDRRRMQDIGLMTERASNVSAKLYPATRRRI